MLSKPLLAVVFANTPLARARHIVIPETKWRGLYNYRKKGGIDAISLPQGPDTHRHCSGLCNGKEALNMAGV